jgi:hypothetical protein
MYTFCLVGKSSVINVLVGSSKNDHGVVRVGVAAQPGKTKHFQTLLLPDRSDMMLCDCPGLVFPSFVSSTADLIAAGVFPIAQMRDHWPVVSLICKRVPRAVLNAHYGIHIPEPSEHELREKGLWGKPLPPPTAEELLGTYCIARSVIAPARQVCFAFYSLNFLFVLSDHSMFLFTVVYLIINVHRGLLSRIIAKENYCTVIHLHCRKTNMPSLMTKSTNERLF